MPLLYPREMMKEILEEKRIALVDGARETLFELVDTVFFASLMLEEGEAVRIAVVHDEGGASSLETITDSEPVDWGGEPAPLAWDVTRIERHPFEPRVLGKLSRGLKYGTHLLVVGGRSPTLWVDGIARRAPRTNGGRVTRIAAPRPGVLAFEEEDRELFRFDAGERVSPAVDVLSDMCPVRSAVATIIGQVGKKAGFFPPGWALMRLLRQMRATGAGAILAMLPHVPDDRVLNAVNYRRTDAEILERRILASREGLMAWVNSRIAIHDKDEVSAEQARRVETTRDQQRMADEALDHAIEDVAQLSAIDGAVLVGPRFAVYGGGYLIPSATEVPAVRALDPAMVDLGPFGRRHGARHQAAFSFAYNNPAGVAFVVSEDGPVSCALRVGERVVVWPVHVSET